MDELLRSQVTVMVAFRGVSPIKWDRFTEDLKEFEYEDFGQGVAVTHTGEQTPVSFAQKDKCQWTYLPKQKQLVLKGTDPDETIGHFKDVKEKIQGQFGKRKWTKNFRFFEMHIVYEFEPSESTPMEIMRSIAPAPSLAHFDEVFETNKPTMYAFRLASWENSLPPNLRDAVPWYEMSFQPMIENTDRVICEIVSRNIDLELVQKMADRLRVSLFSFIEKYDTGD